MTEPVVYVDRSEVREGMLDELELGLKALSDFVARNEPQIVSYAAFLDETRTHVTVIHVHRDVESLTTHMEVAGPQFAGFVDLVKLLSIDIYGSVTPALLAKLRQKADLLEGAVVRTHGLHAGFVRAPQ